MAKIDELDARIGGFEKKYKLLQIVLGLLVAAVVGIFWAGYLYHGALNEIEGIRKIKGLSSDDVTFHHHGAVNVALENERSIGEHRYCAISKFSNAHPNAKCTCDLRKKGKEWVIVLADVNDVRCECIAGCIK